MFKMEFEKTNVLDVYSKISSHFSSTRYLKWEWITDFLDNFKKLDLDVEGVDISSESLHFDNDLKIKLCDVEKEKLPFSKYKGAQYNPDAVDFLMQEEVMEAMQKTMRYEDIAGGANKTKNNKYIEKINLSPTIIKYSFK